MCHLTYEGVDGLEASLHGLVHGLADDNARGFDLHTALRHIRQRAFSVDGVAQTVNNAAEHALAHGDVDDGACGKGMEG